MDVDTSVQPLSHYEYVMADRDLTARTKTQAYFYMNQLVGWCSEGKAGVLIDLILRNRSKVIVEIGVWGGKSLVPMALALQSLGEGTIYGIDPWETEESLKEVMDASNIAHWSQVDHKAVMHSLIDHIGRFGLQERVQLLECTSEQAPLIYDIDVLHIDGNHSEKNSYFDVTKWEPSVKRGGWIILDDMTWYEKGTFTTARAAQYLDERCTKIGEFTDNCVWGIWVK